MTSDRIRWGILGTGRIAQKFASDLALLPDAALVAVGSRSQGAADGFGDQFNVPRRHASYEALAADPDLDAIYIATPHTLHRPNTLLCLDAGKAVLCEKPFALSASEGAEMVGRARAQGLFLMEAMWTRYLPALVQVREWLAAGVLGEVRMVLADFGFQAPFDPTHRLFDPTLGGGALLDVGIYCVSLASLVLGQPDRVGGMAQLGATGVDEASAMVLGYPSGAMAVLSAALRVGTPMEAQLLGTGGRLRLHAPFWKPSAMTLSLYDQPEQLIEMPFDGFGYQFEAAEVGRCLQAGLTESPTMPLDETLAILTTLDTLRAQWGLRYPGEADS